MTHKPFHRRAFAASWHDGERHMQRRAGSDEALADFAPRIYRNHLGPSQAAFVELLPYVVAGSVDGAGDPWVTVLEGLPGLLSPQGVFALVVNAARNATDPADAGLDDGHAVGLLCIDLAMRRRLRLNGWLRREADARFMVEIEQCFGICHKYIQARRWIEPALEHGGGLHEQESLEQLDPDAVAMITDADTVFVSSYVDRGDVRQVDASHRGGLPGFVRVEPEGVLTMPEFPGNRMYNTLGNFFLNPRGGLTFIDFSTGDMLQLSGQVTLNSGPAAASFPKAEQTWRFIPQKIIRRRRALASRWQLPADGISAQSEAMGRWESGLA